LALHSLVVLGGWFLFGSEDRPRVTYRALVEPGRRLTLTAIFDGISGKSDGGNTPQPKAINTKVEDPPAIDTKAQLLPSPEFNQVVPIEVPRVGAAPDATSTVLPSAGPPDPGHGAGGQRGASFFQVASPARSVVYVIDRSGSMGPSGALRRAQAELTLSLRQLPPDVQFQVLVYNNEEPQFLVGPEHLLPARPDAIDRCVRAVGELHARGETDHYKALLWALGLTPDVIYFVTDGEDLTPKAVQKITTQNNGRTTIHVIELVHRRTPRLDGALVQLASTNRGTYRCVSPEQ
jgi:hypothetical protein